MKCPFISGSNEGYLGLFLTVIGFLLGVSGPLTAAGGPPQPARKQAAPATAKRNGKRANKGKNANVNSPQPVFKRPAPNFQLHDIDQNTRSLAEFRGRPVALFFFCGCSWCADVAREWATLQRTGALSESLTEKPVTVVVYAGLDAEGARNLATTAGMDLAQTVLLPDPEARISTQLYSAEPCPRTFVIDPRGILKYTNRGPDDAPRKAPALVITSRTLDALQTAAHQPTGAHK